MTGNRAILRLAALAILFALPAHAAPVATTADAPLKKKFEACLKKAEEYPDMTLADAGNWLKQGGGEYARLCHASANFNIGEFDAAGKEFRDLADIHAKSDPRHAAELYARAGLAYTRSHDEKAADAAYAKAVKLEPDDPDSWIDRATNHAASEHYWDAISDLNRALAIMPDQPEALRMRGQAWLKLGNDKNAERDFMAAEQIDATESGKPIVPDAPAAPTPPAK